MSKKPTVYVIAGPNGSGKTTFAMKFLPESRDCHEFVNADLIAKGLSPLASERAALPAGRLVLKKIEAYRTSRKNFGFETTLSGKSYLRTLKAFKQSGYAIEIYFLWVRTVDLALKRVADRVKNGGHDIPETDVRRRYKSGLKNFLELYWPMADFVAVIDNSAESPRLVALGDSTMSQAVDVDLLEAFETSAGTTFRGIKK